MAIGKGIPSRDEFLKITLAKKGAVIELLNLARESGDRKAATSLQSIIRKLDKLLAKDGMNPNA